MARRFYRVSKQTVWGGTGHDSVCTRQSPGAPKPQTSPKPRSARQTFEGQPRSTRRGVSSFPREPSADEATAVVETRAVDKWLPCLNLLDYEWDKDSDSDDISVSGEDPRRLLMTPRRQRVRKFKPWGKKLRSQKLNAWPVPIFGYPMAIY